jgi:hypothetical protein
MSLFTVKAQQGTLKFSNPSNPPVGSDLFMVENPGSGNASITLSFYKDVQLGLKTESGCMNGHMNGNTFADLALIVEHGGQKDTLQIREEPPSQGWKDWNEKCESQYDFKKDVEYTIRGCQVHQQGADANNTNVVAKLLSYGP